MSFEILLYILKEQTYLHIYEPTVNTIEQRHFSSIALDVELFQQIYFVFINSERCK